MGFKFSKSSQAKLATCHPKLQAVMNEVIKHYDCIILYGQRSVDEQFNLYQQGRKKVDGKWVVVDKTKVVTNCDGKNIKSNHNYNPSRAIDIAPYPLDWNDHARFKKLAEIVFQCAGELDVALRWGHDWDRDGVLGEKGEWDLPHFELI